jgi:hypothetical protein
MAKGRKSSVLKSDLVLSHLRGESIEVLSREHNVSIGDLTSWVETFKLGGKLSLKSKPQNVENYELEQAKRLIADQALAIDILKKRNLLIDKLNKKSPRS